MQKYESATHKLLCTSLHLIVISANLWGIYGEVNSVVGVGERVLIKGSDNIVSNGECLYCRCHAQQPGYSS